MQPTTRDTRRDLHRTTVHLTGIGGARFELLKYALFAVQDEAGPDAISIVIHRRSAGVQ